MEQLTTLEKAVLEKLLNGKSDVFQILCKQCLALQVVNRGLTGVGFWTNFTIPSGTMKLSGSASFWFGDLHAEIDGLEHGAGFELLVKDGCLRMLEGYSYDEPWPGVIHTFRIYYESGSQRNEDEVIKSFTPAQPGRVGWVTEDYCLPPERCLPEWRPRLSLDDEPRALALLATTYDRPVEYCVVAKLRRAWRI